MKKIKKLLALGLALIMCLGMATTASAEAVNGLGDGEGKITITNPSPDVTYTAYRLFNASVSEDGKIAYTATKAQVDAINEAVTGNKPNPFSFEETTVNDLYNVSIGEKTPAVKDDNGNVTTEATYYDGKDIEAFFSITTGEGEAAETNYNEALLKSVSVAYDKKSAGTPVTASTTVEFDDIPYGYYIVTSSAAAALTINSTDPSAVVIDKNQNGPTFDEKDGKVIVKADGTTEKINSANYGDVIDFKITINTTNYNAEEFINNYFVKDVLGNGMSYVTDDNDELIVKVSVGGIKLENTDDVTLYSVSEISEVKDDATDENKVTGHSFTISIPWVNQEKQDDNTVVAVLDENGNPTFKYASPNTITVEYSARVNNNAVIAGDGNKNKASFAYSTGEGAVPTEPGDDDYEKITSETITYVFALAINKVEAGTNKALSGAKFTVALAGIDDSETPIYVKKTGDGIYEYCSMDDDDASEFIESPESGLIVIKGVKGDISAKEVKYVIKETEAPKGYNLLTDKIYVTPSVVDKNSYKTEILYKIDADGNRVEIEREEFETIEENKENVISPVPVEFMKVENNAGSLLPSTGGIGTTIFYVVGGLLVAGAGILLITKKRMSKEQ